MDKTMHVFVIEAKPNQDSEYKSYGDSRVHIWVRGGDIDSAKAIMLNHVRSHHWIPKEIVSAYSIPLPLTDNLDTQESALYHRALQYGVASDFLNWKKDFE